MGSRFAENPSYLLIQAFVDQVEFAFWGEELAAVPETDNRLLLNFGGSGHEVVRAKTGIAWLKL